MIDEKNRDLPESLSVRQAFSAMCLFLESYYMRTKADDVGGLLGGLSLLQDGLPADPGYHQEWREAVRAAMGGREVRLEIDRP